MVYYQQKKGLGDVGSYQVSGIPYTTSSFTIPPLGTAPLKIDFPTVSKFVTIVNSGSTTNRFRVGFSSLGVTGSVASVGGLVGTNNYFTLESGDSFTGEWRVASIYLLSDIAGQGASASIIAGLTGITSGSLPLNWTGTIGVG